MSDVLSFGGWRNNAEMMVDVARLGHVSGRVLDVTYHSGKFWTMVTPSGLVANDLHPDRGDFHHDLRSDPPAEWLEAFDTVVVDPPYRMSGRRDLDEFDDRYGLDQYNDAEVPGLLADSVVFGAACMRRNPMARLLIKCQDQQWSGKLFEQTRLVEEVAHGEGLRVIDRFHLAGSVRKQGRKQRSARNNYSTLLVFGVGKSAWRRSLEKLGDDHG